MTGSPIRISGNTWMNERPTGVRGGRIRLEKYREEDRSLYSQLVFSEETMNMNFGRVFTEEEAGMFFQAILDINASDPELGVYKVFVTRENRDVCIGMGALTRNDEYDAAEIEYMLLPQYWNRGYGSELVGILIQMAADARVSSRIVALTDPSNLYSKRILLKYGFGFVKRYLNDDKEPVELYLIKI